MAFAGAMSRLRWIRHAFKIRGPRTQCLHDGEITIKQAAARLGIKGDAIYHWIWLGQVPARRDPSGRWCIPWDPETQQIYRQKVARSFRHTPKNPSRS